MSEKYVLIIDTDSYAGNFEREMCAFCTGVVGQCDVGSEEKDKFIADYDDEKADEMWELLEQKADDNGCMRPVSLDYFTPGEKVKYNSVCIHMNEEPSQEVIDMIKERAVIFTKGKDRISNKSRTMKVIGFRLKKLTTTTEDIKMAECQDYQQEMTMDEYEELVCSKGEIVKRVCCLTDTFTQIEYIDEDGNVLVYTHEFTDCLDPEKEHKRMLTITAPTGEVLIDIEDNEITKRRGEDIERYERYDKEKKWK